MTLIPLYHGIYKNMYDGKYKPKDDQVAFSFFKNKTIIFENQTLLMCKLATSSMSNLNFRSSYKNVLETNREMVLLMPWLHIAHFLQFFLIILIFTFSVVHLLTNKWCYIELFKTSFLSIKQLETLQFFCLQYLFTK